MVHDSPGTGTTTVTFRVSDELVSRGQDAAVLGGCIPPGGTGGPPPDCSVFNDGPTTGTIVFRTVIQDQFTDDVPLRRPQRRSGRCPGRRWFHRRRRPGGGRSGLRPARARPTAATVGETVPRGSPDKIHLRRRTAAICWPCTGVEVDPGDTLTFRLQYGLPTSDFEDLVADRLPAAAGAPRHRSDDLRSDRRRHRAAGRDGQVRPGRHVLQLAPAGFSDFVTDDHDSDSIGNSVTFTYGNYDDPTIPPPSTAVDILFTVTVSNDPFTDRLLLTNLLRVHEGSTNSTDQDGDGIVQFTLREPFLAVKKGVIATDDAGGVFTPATTGPTPFSPPGSAGPRFAGTIDSTDLTATPIDSNLAAVDADDLVSFAISIENLGSSPSGAFDIVVTDSIPAGFVIPGGGPQPDDHAGRSAAPVSFLGAAADLFTPGGIELVDPGLGTGVCEAHSPTSGRNIIVITYDLQIDPSAEPAAGHHQHGRGRSTTPAKRAARITPAPGRTRPSRTRPMSPSPRRRSPRSSSGRTRPTPSASTSPSASSSSTRRRSPSPKASRRRSALVDTLDAGLAFVSIDSLSASPALTTDVVGGFPQVLADAQAALAAPGASATFDFGTLDQQRHRQRRRRNDRPDLHRRRPEQRRQQPRRGAQQQRRRRGPGARAAVPARRRTSSSSNRRCRWPRLRAADRRRRRRHDHLHHRHLPHRRQQCRCLRRVLDRRRPSRDDLRPRHAGDSPASAGPHDDLGCGGADV